MMTRTALLLSVAIAGLAGSAAAETKAYTVGVFDRIDANHAIDVVYVQGATTSVSVEQDDGDFSDIIIAVEDGELVLKRASMKQRLRGHSIRIRHRHGERVIRVDGKTVPTYLVHITSPDLTAIDASASSIVTAAGIDADHFSADVSSSANMTLSGQAQSLDLDASSSADLEAANLIAGSLTIDASSSADIYATSTDGNVSVDAASSSDVSLTSTGGDVEIAAASSTDVKISGRCDALIVAASSSADVMLGNLVCSTGDLAASSSADVTAHVTGTIKAQASSSGDVVVRGSPAILEVKTSSGGDIDITG